MRRYRVDHFVLSPSAGQLLRIAAVVFCIVAPIATHAFLSYTTQSCTASYGPRVYCLNKITGESLPCNTDCRPEAEGTFYVTVSVNTPDQDVAAGTTFYVTGSTYFHVCINLPTAGSVTVTMVGDNGETIVKSQALTGTNDSFSVGPFGPFTQTGARTISIQTTLSNGLIYFDNRGSMQVTIIAPAVPPTNVTLTARPYTTTWDRYNSVGAKLSWLWGGALSPYFNLVVFDFQYTPYSGNGTCAVQSWYAPITGSTYLTTPTSAVMTSEVGGLLPNTQYCARIRAFPYLFFGYIFEPFASPWVYAGPVVTVVSDRDVGLRLYDGFGVVQVGAEPEGALTSPLRIAKNSKVHGVVLVPPSDPSASRFRVKTASGVMAARRVTIPQPPIQPITTLPNKVLQNPVGVGFLRASGDSCPAGTTVLDTAIDFSGGTHAICRVARDTLDNWSQVPSELGMVTRNDYSPGCPIGWSTLSTFRDTVTDGVTPYSHYSVCRPSSATSEFQTSNFAEGQVRFGPAFVQPEARQWPNITWECPAGLLAGAGSGNALISKNPPFLSAKNLCELRDAMVPQLLQ